MTDTDTYKEEENYEKPKRKGINIGLIILFVIIGIVIIAIIAAAIIQVPYTVSESYIDKVASEEHYTESVPYNDQDCNDIQMIYKITWGNNAQTCLQNECASYNQVCSEKNFWGNCVKYNDVCASYKCVKYNNHCELNVENKERETLALQLQVQKWSRDSNSASDVSGYPTTYYVTVLDTKKILWDFSSVSTESVSCIYSVKNNPTRSECKDVVRYRNEDRTRTIYTDVTKYRDITKYCSALNKLVGNCK